MKNKHLAHFQIVSALRRKRFHASNFGKKRETSKEFYIKLVKSPRPPSFWYGKNDVTSLEIVGIYGNALPLPTFLPCLPFSRICNAAEVSISICNAKKDIPI